jgi:glycosyltransferase involved in cell wall biosynthesis
VPEVVLPGITGLLAAPERPDQLAAAIRFMLDRPAEAARMAEAGRRLVAGRFSTEALAEVLEATYSDSPHLPRQRYSAALAETA